MGRQAETLVRTAPARKPAPRNPFAFLKEDDGSGEPVSLATVDADTMRDAVAAWVELGHAITIGRTSDGGAVAITLLANGHRQAKYFHDLALFEDFLVTLRAASAEE